MTGLLLIALIAGRSSPVLGLVSSWFSGIPAAFVHFGVSTGAAVSAFGRAVRSPGRTRALEQEVGELRATIAVLERARAIADAATVTRDALKRVPAAWGDPIIASVVAAQSTGAAEQLTIDRGTRDGVMRGDAVLVRGALIGTVQSVGTGRAVVQLLSDPRSRIAVERATRPGIVGIAESDPGGGIAITAIPRDADVHDGDAIVTGTVNTRIASGIPLGTIVALRTDPDGFFHRATLQPIADPRAEWTVTVFRQPPQP